MKKLLLSIIISLFLCTGVYAGPWISGGSGSGDVTAASTAQTWGDGTGPVVWTFSVTGTDPTISVATAAFTINTDLALGANDITMTGSLGATGARVTKGWFTDLEVTNAPTINGAAWTTILQPLDADLTTIAGLTVADGKVIRGSSSPAWAASTFTMADTYAKGTIPYASTANTITALAHPGAANYALTTNGTDTVAWAATHSHSDSASQFYDASTPTALVTINPATVGTHTISPVGAYEFKYTLTAATDVTMPVAGTLAPIQKGYIALSAGSMIVDTCAAVTQKDSDPNKFSYLAFDKDTEEYAQFQFSPPDDWDAGTIKFKVVWAASDAGTNTNPVIWGLNCYAVSDGDTTDVAFDTGAVTVSDAYATADETGPKQKITAASSALTIQGTPAVGDIVHCRIYRDADAGGDTYEQDAWLMGVRIEYGKNSTVATAW